VSVWDGTDGIPRARERESHACARVLAVGCGKAFQCPTGTDPETHSRWSCYGAQHPRKKNGCGDDDARVGFGRAVKPEKTQSGKGVDAQNRRLERHAPLLLTALLHRRK
jgi:hypothetical protein